MRSLEHEHIMRMKSRFVEVCLAVSFIMSGVWTGAKAGCASDITCCRAFGLMLGGLSSECLIQVLKPGICMV